MKLSIGENIRRLRRGRDMTQEQLADRLGVTYQSVSRWENGSAYPDMELLPAISDIFSVSTDELLGIPEQEKEKQAEELCDELLHLHNKPLPEEQEKERIPMMVDILKKLRRDYAGCDSLWKLWLYDYDWQGPLLAELRLLAEVRLEKRPGDVETIKRMSALEDDEHIDAFLKRYATEYDIGKESLLLSRYMRRNERDKAAPLRHKELFEMIDDAVCKRFLYMETNAKTLEHCFAENTARLGIMHAFNGETPTKEHPITCGNGVDYWAEVKINEIGIRRAAYLASMGKTEEAFAVLEDIVSLLEEVMKITDKIDLPSSRFTPTIAWTAQEDWSRELGSEGPFERFIYIDSSIHNCFCVYPSATLQMLTAPHGWEWFDPIRSDPRYQGYVERVKKLVQTKE